MLVRWIVLPVLAASCAFAAEPLQFEARWLNREVSGCEVKFDWIEVTSGPPAVRSRINAALLEFFLSPTGDRPKDARLGPETAYKNEADSFISQCRREEKDGLKANWSLADSVTVLRDRPPFFSFQYSSHSYEGGAHPNSDKWFLTVDAETGREVELTSIMVDGFLPRLTEIAEPHFRAVRHLSPTANLKEEGFLWPDGRFQLNENYAFGETSLIFVFTTYEIASHAHGETRLEIPYAEIQDLLKPEFRNLSVSAPPRQ
jgi:hypothetical protein